MRQRRVGLVVNSKLRNLHNCYKCMGVFVLVFVIHAQFIKAAVLSFDAESLNL